MARPTKISDDEILLGARAVFLARGPAVATSEIATALGVSQATLFHRFGSKRTLLIESLRPRDDPALLALLGCGPGERPIPEQLRQIGLAIAGQCARVDPAVTMLRAAGVARGQVFDDPASSPLVRLRQSLQAWLARAHDSGRVAAGDPRTTATLFIGALHRRPYEPGGSTTVTAASVDALVRTLWLGLAPRAVAS